MLGIASPNEVATVCTEWLDSIALNHQKDFKMNVSNLLRVTTLGVILAISGGAYAKSTSTPQTHHCKLQDGSMDMKKTKKQCLAASGTWAKDADAAAAAPAAPAVPAAAPAPKN